MGIIVSVKNAAIRKRTKIYNRLLESNKYNKEDKLWMLERMKQYIVINVIKL